MTRTTRLALCASLLCGVVGSWGCGTRYSLTPSYGNLYRAVFMAQTAEHHAREVGPVRGDEARRIYGKYLLTVGEDPDGQGGTGGGSSGGSSTTTMLPVIGAGGGSNAH